MLTKAYFLLLACVCAASAQTTAAPTAAPAQTRVQEVRGFFREYALDHSACGPAIVTVDEDENVWVALAKTGKLARFANGEVELYEIGADSRPVGLVAGTRANGHPGEIWIAASYDNKIVRFDTARRATREYKIEGDSSWPFNIALGPDGSVWFTQRAAARVGRLDPVTGQVQHFEVPTQNGGPAGLAVDQHTGTVWFTESYADRIASLDPTTGRITEYKMSDKSTGLVSGPAGLALDSQGGVWFAKLEGKLGHLSPGSDSLAVIDVPPQARRPAGITVAPDGGIWAVALDGNLLMRYDPRGQSFMLYPLPTGASDEHPGQPPIARTSRPFGIAVDHQGNVWCSEQYTGQLAVLDLAPPELKILSPETSVRTSEPLFTLRATDRVGGVQTLAVTLDGKAVTVERGRLNLSGLMPGKHRLEAVATDGAGLSTTAALDFTYEPGQFALQEMLSGLVPKNDNGRAVQKEILTLAQELSKGDVRAKLDEIRLKLDRGASLFKPFPAHALNAAFEFQKEHAAQTVEVRLLDTPPYFSTDKIVVRPGDTVRWKYDPPSDGHYISANLHRIEIGGVNVRSELLRAGESFTYRFEQAGEFLIKDTEKGAGAITVKVVNK